MHRIAEPNATAIPPVLDPASPPAGTAKTTRSPR